MYEMCSDLNGEMLLKLKTTMKIVMKTSLESSDEKMSESILCQSLRFAMTNIAFQDAFLDSMDEVESSIVVVRMYENALVRCGNFESMISIWKNHDNREEFGRFV